MKKSSDLEPDNSIEIATYKLKMLWSLQTCRDLYLTSQEYPYVTINLELLEAKIEEEKDIFAALSMNTFYQNMSDYDRAVTMAQLFVGEETRLTSTSEVLPSGQVNPLSHNLVIYNDPLTIPTDAIFSTGPFLKVFENNKKYQYFTMQIGKANKKDIPLFNTDLSAIDFLKQKFYSFYQNKNELSKDEFDTINELLNDIVTENITIINDAIEFHKRNKPNNSKYNYHSPNLTLYGKLAHNSHSEPEVVHDLIQFHFHKVIFELNEAKLAHDSMDSSKEVFHGAHCIMSLAFLIEAISNKCYFLANSKHKDPTKNHMKAEELLIQQSQALARKNKKSIKLTKSSEEYKALEKVRQIRNSFVHAEEQKYKLDPDTRFSELFTEVTWLKCKELVESVRKALSLVLDNISETFGRPLPIHESEKWIGK